MWNTCKVKNISGGTKTFYNKELTNNEEYTIPDSDRNGWINDTIYGDIAADDLQVGDGSTYFTGYADQWSWLQNVDNEPRDTDGNKFARFKITKSGWGLVCHTVEFETSKLSSVFNKKFNQSDFGWATLKFYDDEDNELTTQESIDTDCVKTVLIWEPDETIQIRGGSIYPGVRATVDMRVWFKNTYSGHEFCSGGFDLRRLPDYGSKVLDGGAPKELPYVEGAGITKCELLVLHPEGHQKTLQVVLDLFTS